MSEMRACKECGKMFMPKGREKYCSDVHYRPCPVCGTPVVAKYLSDPPAKCDNCKGKHTKVQPASKAKALFDINEPNLSKPVILNINLAQAAKFEQKAKAEVKAEVKVETSTIRVTTTDNTLVKIDISRGFDPEKFCETYDDKIMKYVGPNFGQFENNHDYKIALTRNENYYLITSCHDVTDNKEVKCFYLASSQLNISNRFAVVGQD